MATVGGLLQGRARTRGSARAFVFLDERATPVTYAELDSAARRVAAALVARGAAGEPVLLLYPPGRAYVEGFFGCLYAGAIAVPAYPPDPARLGRTMPRLRALIADCGARLALTVSGLGDVVPAGLDWLATDDLPAGDHAGEQAAHEPALLQYTSGSTGAPKGVLLSHANLLHNAELVRVGFGTSPASVGVSWLPPYHDMGLLGGIVQPVYAGLPLVLMSPLTFLQRPMIWLETISRYGATVSGGPNFAFDLCVRKSTPAERAELDLSRWEVAFSGAEPVRAETLDRFAEAFAPAGFRPEAFYPCYGLAEATLIVTGGRRTGRAGRVGCGTVLGDQTLAIVDPVTHTAAAPGVEGEIWLSGPSVATGYWHRPEETEHIFHAHRADDPGRRYLRTGDLGFLDPQGELTVTGRAKDLIIIRGRNVYPQDLEHTVERVAGVRPGCSAAFAVERDGEERVVVVCEVAQSTVDTMPAVRRVLAETHEVDVADVVLLRPRTIPKTSSGKIQRHACRQAYLDGELDVVARWDQATTDLLDQLTALPPGTPLTELGLDSLKAVELRHTLQERLGLDVSIAELLGGITVGELTTRERVEPVPVVAEPGLSDGQRALWFLQQWARDGRAYQITRAARIRSPLDAAALDRALRAVVARHPALRTRLPSAGGEPAREVFDWDGPVLEHRDLATLDADTRRGFDLERGPLLRVSLYSRGPDDHILLFSVHHIVADFWSLSVLVDELLELYSAEVRGVSALLPAVGPAAPSAITDLTARLEYWRTALSGAPPAMELPTTYPRPRLQSFRGATQEFRLDAATVRDLDAVARQAGATRFVTVLAAFAALLSRYAGEDLVIGTPTAGREDRHTARQVGYFVNPVPLRIRVEPGVSFHGLVATARRVVLDALEHVVPFPRLVEAIRPVRDPGRAPVMQVTMTLQQSPPGRPDLGAFAVADETTRLRLGGLDLQPHRLPQHDAMFDLSLMLTEVSGGLSCVLEYCADLFDAATVGRMCHQLATLLQHAVSTPDSPVDTIELLDAGERAAVLDFADGGPVSRAEPATLPALFARQVASRGDANAVVFGRESLSYTELDARASRLAAVLRGRLGVTPRGVVGVHLPRGVDWLVAFWAVLKAGGTYLPLPPDLPAGRLTWMIEDANPAVVLSRAEIEASASAAPCGDAAVSPDDLAYVIYTSGSTGRPKGVLVPHRGAANVADAEATALAITESDRVLQYASPSFDVSIVEILIAHLHGAALHIAPPDAAVPGPELVRLLAEQQITAAALSPSVLAALPDAALPDLTGLIAGGESCPAEVVTRWGPGRRFRNAYGPTEATICATIAECEPDGTRPSIGRPIPGVRAYVLDPRLRPVPVGVPGELYLGGVGVARGYVGRPDLTAERFLSDPFAGGRMYRTGDRARWLPDGQLDFLGRLDDQVKIRGIRIEPGEIEVRLRELFGLRAVAVVARPAPSGTELVAYLVAGGQRVPVAELRGRLRAELPDPWVPAAFVYLDRLPLTASDKLDRTALPPPTPADRGVGERHDPRTELERVVAEVWAAVLGQDAVGVRNHFFDELGGSSLLVAKVTSALRDRLGREVPVTDLFEYPTVEALARHLARASTATEDTQPEEHAAARRNALARRARARSGSEGAGAGAPAPSTRRGKTAAERMSGATVLHSEEPEPR